MIIVELICTVMGAFAILSTGMSDARRVASPVDSPEREQHARNEQVTAWVGVLLLMAAMLA